MITRQQIQLPVETQATARAAQLTSESAPVQVPPQAHPATIIQRAQRDPKSLTPQDVRQLHHTLGNRAVGRLLTQAVQRQPAPTQENHTGLPDHLKAGVEALSGLSLDDVQVHYNSLKPVQLQALAYAQGTEIYVGPGQEQYLPHEAWHVVQQKQGRVQPMLQSKEPSAGIRGTVSINDDAALEHEADVMGQQSLSFRPPQTSVVAEWAKANKKVIDERAPRLKATFIEEAKGESNRVVIQCMPLTPLGSNVAMRGELERFQMGNLLMHGSNITDYTNDICYDTVAFTRYLLGANITPNQLINTNGNDWLPFFNFAGGIPWGGEVIPAGTAVGFQRVGDDQAFHAALAIGGTVVRGVNGGLLGAGWQAAGDRDIATLTPAGELNTYIHDNQQIHVWLSNL